MSSERFDTSRLKVLADGLKMAYDEIEALFLALRRKREEAYKLMYASQAQDACLQARNALMELIGALQD
jgi:hypothetical protein